eukprot:gene7703-biopygen16575
MHRRDRWFRTADLPPPPPPKLANHSILEVSGGHVSRRRRSRAAKHQPCLPRRASPLRAATMLSPAATGVYKLAPPQALSLFDKPQGFDCADVHCQAAGAPAGDEHPWEAPKPADR